MKLYRFMSGKELHDLLSGEPLANTADQNKDRRMKSTAVGFCFGIGDYKQAKIDFRRLNGIVTPVFLVVFEPKNISNFTKCKGYYVDYEATEEIYGSMLRCPSVRKKENGTTSTVRPYTPANETLKKILRSIR